MNAEENFSLEDIEGEVWKDIPDYENLYQGSSFGRIKALEKIRNTGNNGRTIRTYPEKILKPCLISRYFKVNLCSFGKQKFCLVHRLIAITFLENLKNYEQVNHKNSNKLDNSFENLEWVTRRENQCHKSINSINTSKYIGVSLYKTTKKWQSRIKFNGKNIYLGCFNTEEEAYAKRVQFEIKNNIENRYL